MSTALCSHPLHEGSTVFLDRSYDRQTKKHTYQVLIVRNAVIEAYIVTTTDKPLAAAAYQGVIARWA
jgi:hypothetical protein